MLMPHGNRITANDNAAETGVCTRTSAGTSEMIGAIRLSVSLLAFDFLSRLHHQLKRC
jgi:hypothetical protein